MQQPTPPNYNEIIMRQLERLEQRFEERFSTLEQRMRSDLDNLRKELVARDSLEPQLADFRRHIVQVDNARIEDKKTLEKRVDQLETEAMTRQDRLWIRFGQGLSALAFILALFEFLSHVRFLP